MGHKQYLMPVSCLCALVQTSMAYIHLVARVHRLEIWRCWRRLSMHGLHCHSQRRESVAFKAWKMLVSVTHQSCLLQLCCVLQRRVALVCLGHLGKIPGMCLVTALYCTGGCARIRCKIPLSTAGVRVAASIASVRVAASTAGPRTGTAD